MTDEVSGEHYAVSDVVWPAADWSNAKMKTLVLYDAKSYRWWQRIWRWLLRKPVVLGVYAVDDYPTLQKRQERG